MIAKSGLVPISIPAPVWGATGLAGQEREQVEISIPAPVWGGDSAVTSDPPDKLISIPAPVWGATANLYKNKLLQICKMT